MNHVMYADDICLMAPSPASLQELIDIYYDFSVQSFYISMNVKKRSIFQLIQMVLFGV